MKLEIIIILIFTEAIEHFLLLLIVCDEGIILITGVDGHHLILLYLLLSFVEIALDNT